MSDEAPLGIEAEAPPPLGIFGAPPAPPPEGESPDYDQWGNLKINPVKAVEEVHGENFVKIFLYQYRDSFFYGFQLKIEKVVRQKRANIGDPALGGIESARAAAKDQIIDICKRNHGIKRLFADFTIIRYNQPELF
jgi:hypothetical protein